MLSEYDYFVLCTDKDCFLMKSVCIENGWKYIDFVEDLLEDVEDEDEIEQILYGEDWE